MAQKIDEMSMKQICDEYGVLTARTSLIYSLNKNNPNVKRIEEFIQKFYPLNKFLGAESVDDFTIEQTTNYDAMQQLTCEYQDIFDKEAYVYELYRMLLDKTAFVDLNGVVRGAQIYSADFGNTAPTIVTKKWRNEFLKKRNGT